MHFSDTCQEHRIYFLHESTAFLTPSLKQGKITGGLLKKVSFIYRVTKSN